MIRFIMEIPRLLEAGGGILNYQELLNMFAVIKTGGKQYQVSEGDILRVDKLEGNVGDKVSLDHVLMVGEGDKVKIGDPTVKGSSVTGVVTRQFRDRKIIIFKFKRRKKYRNKNGHRQSLTELKITNIKE